MQTWLAPQGVHHQVLGWCFSSVAPSPLIPPTAAPTPGWPPVSCWLFCSPQRCVVPDRGDACWAGGVSERAEAEGQGPGQGVPGGWRCGARAWWDKGSGGVGGAVARWSLHHVQEPVSLWMAVAPPLSSRCGWGPALRDAPHSAPTSPGSCQGLDGDHCPPSTCP